MCADSLEGRVVAGGGRNSARRARRWVPYVGGLLLLGLIAFGLWPKPVPVEIASVSRGVLRATIDEEGKTRIKQRYVVAAPVTGQLRRIPFKAGAEVVVDETVVAVIDPVAPALLDARSRAAAQARLESASANLDKAKAEHLFSASELRRFQQLYSEKTIAIQDLEAARMRDSSAAKAEASAEGDLRRAQAELDVFGNSGGSQSEDPCPTREIKAPASGRVLRLYEENARVVSAGTPLMEIGDPSNLEVVIEVLSRDGAVIPQGAKVEFEQWGGPAPLVGRVRLVEPAAFTKVSALGVEEQRVNVIADLLTPPQDRRNVGDNFRVEAKIIIWESPDTLKVPAGALFREGDQWAAFEVVDGRATLRTVKAGRSSGTETQVLDGLSAGAKVILYPSSRVREGTRVSPIQVAPRS
ncbi:MAG TPA: efflux RND transporter periplasmic adaptor subunit [Verrucomicrobiae bacterium]|nr:efflux RND transporter periplasmic adaptor subunit [Verrucomicrobiae bacterium]